MERTIERKRFLLVDAAGAPHNTKTVDQLFDRTVKAKLFGLPATVSSIFLTTLTKVARFFSFPGIAAVPATL